MFDIEQFVVVVSLARDTCHIDCLQAHQVSFPDMDLSQVCLDAQRVAQRRTNIFGTQQFVATAGLARNS